MTEEFSGVQGAEGHTPVAPDTFETPAGLPEGATAAHYPPRLTEAWTYYFDNYRHNSIDMTERGGAIVRIGPDSAVYTFPGKAPIYLHRGSNLNALALRDDAIAAEWKKDFGFEPVPLA
jgi:hypothetical protein